MNRLRHFLGHGASTIVALVLFVAAAPTYAQSVGFAWHEVGPPSRKDHAAVYDPIGDRLVLFGGLEGSTRHDDVWMLSLGGTPTWSQPTVFSLAPSARADHSAIYDPVRQRMIVFGGNDGSRENDVWALELSGPLRWTPLSPSGTPPSARQYHAAVFDPVGDRMLVFGGDDGADRNDVWALTLGASPAWTLLTPSGAPPSARQGASAMYDPLRQRMLVFGGLAGGTFQNDTWSLDLTGPPAWAPVATTGTLPPARAYHNAVYDPVRDRMLVTWGSGGSSFFSSPNSVALTLAGTPQWQTLVGIDWAMKLVAAYDPVRDRLLVHGGATGSVVYDDAMAINLSAPGFPVRIVPVSPLGSLSDASGIIDPVNHRFVVFGGTFSDGFEVNVNNAAYGLDTGTGSWTALGAVPSNSARSGHSANYVPAGATRMVVFGGGCLGIGCGAAPYNDVWQLPLDPPGAWQPLAPSGTPPPGRSRHSAIYDPVRNSLIVFGGIGQEVNPPIVRFNDVWELNLNGTPSWSQWAPLGTPPSARCGQSGIYDAANQRMVVFGGSGDGGVLLGDVWSLSMTGTPTWTPLSPQGPGPTAREEHVGFYDAANQRMLVYGGTTQSDMWSLSLAGSPAWSPAAIYGHGAAPDAHARLASALDTDGTLWIYGGLGKTPWKLIPSTSVSVRVPKDSDVQLLGALPNPARGPLLIGFALRDHSPARLELFDLSGRRIASREVGSFGAGFHRVELRPSAPLATGAYLVRLTRGTEAFSAKAVVMR